MSRTKAKEYRSLVWLRQVRLALASQDVKGPTSRAVRERQRKVEELITKLGLPRVSADTARSRPRRLA